MGHYPFIQPSPSSVWPLGWYSPEIHPVNPSFSIRANRAGKSISPPASGSCLPGTPPTCTWTARRPCAAQTASADTALALMQNTLDAIEHVMRSGNGEALEDLIRQASDARAGWQMSAGSKTPGAR